MRHLSTMACASVVALAALAVTADGAFAAINLNSSKSNAFKLDSADTNADKVCTGLGGTVATEHDGTKTCTLPPAASTTVRSSKSNSSEHTTLNSSHSNSFKLGATDTNKTCTDKGGSVFTASDDGQKYCVIPAPTSGPAH